MRTIEGTREFYDEFLEKRMVSYVLHGNKRLDMAFNFAIAADVNPETFLDFGCGIGYFSEKVFNQFPGAKGVAVDAGPANVKFARKLLKGHNIDVHEFSDLSRKSISDHFNPLAGDNGYEAIFLIDVIEHLPEEARKAFLKGLRDVIGSKGKLIVTYPSPAYQRHIKYNEPEELQYVDEEIPFEVIVGEARSAGWCLKVFRSADVWLENQYLQFCFVPDLSLSPIARANVPKASLLRRGLRRIERLRRKKLVNQILRDLD